MASLMLQYDRPTDHTRNWNDYNGRVRDWIARLLQTPGGCLVRGPSHGGWRKPEHDHDAGVSHA